MTDDRSLELFVHAYDRAMNGNGDCDALLDELGRLGISLLPDQHSDETKKTISVLNRWYWLMKDIAANRTLERIYFDMGTWVDHVNEEARIPMVAPVEHWCGTTACAAGSAALVGLFPMPDLKPNELGRIGEDLDINWDGAREEAGILEEDWDMITSYGNRSTREETANGVADVIAGVLLTTYAVTVTPLPDHDRPWLGVSAPFEPKPRMRW